MLFSDTSRNKNEIPEEDDDLKPHGWFFRFAELSDNGFCKGGDVTDKDVGEGCVALEHWHGYVAGSDF